MEELTPSRRDFKFRLKMLFLLLTILCGVVGWLGWNWRIVQTRQLLWQQSEGGDLPDQVAPTPGGR